VQAHLFLNLATAGGDKEAAEFKIVVANEMTVTQIEKAQELSVNHY
jgi:hypothetical protein